MKLTDVLMIVGMTVAMGLALWLGDNGFAPVVGAIGLIGIGVFLFAAQIHSMRSSRAKRNR
jgi:type IV secretory pathway VirB2 component (pilin)